MQERSHLLLYLMRADIHVMQRVQQLVTATSERKVKPQSSVVSMFVVKFSSDVRSPKLWCFHGGCSRRLCHLTFLFGYPSAETWVCTLIFCLNWQYTNDLGSLLYCIAFCINKMVCLLLISSSPCHLLSIFTHQAFFLCQMNIIIIYACVRVVPACLFPDSVWINIYYMNSLLSTCCK